MGRLLSGSRACTRVRVREHLYSDLIRGSVVCRLSRNAYRMRLTRHASRGVRNVSFYRARSYKKGIRAIRARPTLILRKSISRDSRVGARSTRGFPMETYIWRGLVSLDATFSEPAFSLIIRILLIINMEMLYVVSVVYSARINSNPPYKYSSLHVEYYVIFIYVFYQIFYILKFSPICARILNKVFVYCNKPSKLSRNRTRAKTQYGLIKILRSLPSGPMGLMSYRVRRTKSDVSRGMIKATSRRTFTCWLLT